jgi:hypothetical protein
LTLRRCVFSTRDCSSLLSSSRLKKPMVIDWCWCCREERKSEQDGEEEVESEVYKRV